MAKLLLINEVTKNAYNNIGDVVAVFEDEQMPTPLEVINFTIAPYPGTANEVWQEIYGNAPPMCTAWKDESNVCHEIVAEPNFWFRYEDGIFKHNFVA